MNLPSRATRRPRADRFYTLAIWACGAGLGQCWAAGDGRLATLFVAAWAGLLGLSMDRRPRRD